MRLIGEFKARTARHTRNKSPLNRAFYQVAGCFAIEMRPATTNCVTGLSRQFRVLLLCVIKLSHHQVMPIAP